MSTASERARAKAARLAATPPADEPAVEAFEVLKEGTRYGVRADVPPPVSTKPIRISLDLAPALFDQLTEWRTRAARQLGRGRVTNADALRVLVRALLSDEELTARVIADLRREAGS